MIILYCIKEGSKLRIKFHSFINHENKKFTNIYNNEYNCKFPKDIRQVGNFYKVPDNDIVLINKENGKPFYSIKKNNIVIMTEEEKQCYLGINATSTDLSTVKIYDAGDCVICLECASSIIFIPCGHKCVCSGCNSRLKIKKSDYNCPVCRGQILEDIIE
jgi:hypothetical protein